MHQHLITIYGKSFGLCMSGNGTMNQNLNGLSLVMPCLQNLKEKANTHVFCLHVSNVEKEPE